jgi:hypothetical protein
LHCLDTTFTKCLFSSDFERPDPSTEPNWMRISRKIQEVKTRYPWLSGSGSNLWISNKMVTEGL